MRRRSPDQDTFTESSDAASAPAACRSTADCATHLGAPPAAPRANDDRRSVATLLYQMQRRPSAAPFWIALARFRRLGSRAGFYVARCRLRRLFGSGRSRPPCSPAPTALPSSVASSPRSCCSSTIATMIWRAQDLRLAARSLSEVAIKLAEPEMSAKENVVTVGQAIRRESRRHGRRHRTGPRSRQPSSRCWSTTKSARSSGPYAENETAHPQPGRGTGQPARERDRQRREGAHRHLRRPSEPFRGVAHRRRSSHQPHRRDRPQRHAHLRLQGRGAGAGLRGGRQLGYRDGGQARPPTSWRRWAPSAKA